MLWIALLATMASVAGQPIKASYQIDSPVSDVRRCIMLHSDRETREVQDGDVMMIGLSTSARFFAVVSLSPVKGGTRMDVRGNGLTSDERQCVTPRV